MTTAGAVAAIVFSIQSAGASIPCAHVDKVVFDAEAATVRLDPGLRVPGAPPVIFVIERQRLVNGTYVSESSLRRRVDPNEDEFRFRFTRYPREGEPYRYQLSAVGGNACVPAVFEVRPARERTRRLFATAVIGMTDGASLQFGSAVWVKRMGVAASIMPFVPGEGTFKADVEAAYRGNRGIFGIGVRRRNDVDVAGSHELAGYVHGTLELPGLRVPLLRVPVSPWLGLELRPVRKHGNDGSWKGAREWGVRLQVRWPRERWMA